MCAYCLSYKCPPRCPNYDESQGSVARCSRCDDYIHEGDRYYDDGGEVICEDCLSNMKASEILEMCGCEMQVA